MRRLFIALFPPRDIAEDLAALQPIEDRQFNMVRWKPIHHLHVTLKFIGEVPEDTCESTRQKLAAIEVRQFMVTFGGMGVFPAKGAPNIIWAGLSKTHPHLFQLHKKIEDSLLQIGIPADLRAYHPHLTVGRCQGVSEEIVQQYLKRHRDYIGPTWKIDRFFLMHSLPKANGHSYVPLDEYPLLPA